MYWFVYDCSCSDQKLFGRIRVNVTGVSGQPVLPRHRPGPPGDDHRRGQRGDGGGGLRRLVRGRGNILIKTIIWKMWYHFLIFHKIFNSGWRAAWSPPGSRSWTWTRAGTRTGTRRRPPSGPGSRGETVWSNIKWNKITSLEERGKLEN